MKKLLVFILPLFLASCSIPFVGGKKSGLKITATPQATVILDGKQVGQTPFDQSDLKPKTYKLQLIPQSGQPWEATITLRESLQTVIDRAFGQNDQESGGYIMDLEPSNNKSDQKLNVMTIPDPSAVRIDGQPKGFAPINATLSSEGNHEVTVSSAGYDERKVSVSVPKGYQLHLVVQLARAQIAMAEPTPSVEGVELTPSEAPTPSPAKDSKLTPAPTQKALSPTSTPKISALTPTPTQKQSVSATPTPPQRPYAEILPTGTKATADAPRDNWLRVRSEGRQTADIVGYVYSGETYKFMESNDVGWYHIQLPDNKDGWISSQYTKLYR